MNLPHAPTRSNLDAGPYPHLAAGRLPTKPGPQPHNRIAGTLAEQLDGAFRPRPPSGPPTRREVRGWLARLDRDAAEVVSHLLARLAAAEDAIRRLSRQGGR